VPFTEDSDFDDGDMPDECYGLALSDSNDFGPYQAGALIGLLQGLPGNKA
jgi:hypothetical protein